MIKRQKSLMDNGQRLSGAYLIMFVWKLTRQSSLKFRMFPISYIPVAFIAAAWEIDAISTFPKLSFTFLKNSSCDAEYF